MPQLLPSGHFLPGEEEAIPTSASAQGPNGFVTPGTGQRCRIGMLARVLAAPGGVSHPPAGCSICGEGCVHGAAPHNSFGSVMMLEGGSQDSVGQEKRRGTSLPHVLGKSQPLAFSHCQPRWEMQAGLMSQQGCWWVCVPPRAFFNQGWCLDWSCDHFWTGDG